MGFSPIFNASSLPLTQQSGTVPNVDGALYDYFQPMTFENLTKSIVGFQLSESISATTETMGVMFPVPLNLAIRKVGQRDWIQKDLYCLPNLVLNLDDVVIYLGVQYRVLQVQDYSQYGSGGSGYLVYRLQQDWTGSGPPS